MPLSPWQFIAQRFQVVTSQSPGPGILSSSTLAAATIRVTGIIHVASVSLRVIAHCSNCSLIGAGRRCDWHRDSDTGGKRQKLPK
jgi:hypothetical protein